MKVPVYEGRQVEPRGLPDGTISSQNLDSGEGVGPGLRAARNVFLQVAQQEAARADHIAVESAETQLSQWTNDHLFNPEGGAFTKKGKDAFGLATNSLPEYDEASNKIGSSLTNERQRMAFDEVRNAQRLSLDESLNRHENSERESYYDQETEATVKDSVASAGNFFNDPRQIRYQIARQERALAAQAERKGWSDEQLSANIKSFTSKTHLEVLDRMLALRQSGAARNYLNRVRGEMNGDDVTTVERALQTDDAVSRQELNNQMADLEAAAKLGKAERAPSRDSLVAAYGETQGDRLYKEGQALLGMSAEVNKLQSKPASELLETAAAYEPQQQEGAASAAQRSAFIDTAARGILKQREEDPASYMISESPQVLAAWQNVANGEEGAADQYFAVANAEAERLEINNKNRLPKGYTDQIVSDILKPKDNETLYASINNERERWGDHWDTVYAQIAPKLPDTAAIIGSGIPPQAGIALSAMSGLKTNEIKALVPAGVEYNDVVDKVRSKFKDMLRSFPPDAGGTRTAEALADSAIRLTLYNTKHGANLNSAVDLAYKDLVQSQNHVIEFRGVTYRAPENLDPADIDLGARELLRNFELPAESTSGFGASHFEPDRLASWTTEDLHERGYWVTDPVNHGLLLYLDGAPVTIQVPLTQDGKPVRKNADGTISTELTITVEDEDINDGKPTNIPSLWNGNELSTDEAIGMAMASGKTYPSFDSVDEAVEAAKQRSASGGAQQFKSEKVMYSWGEIVAEGQEYRAKTKAMAEKLIRESPKE